MGHRRGVFGVSGLGCHGRLLLLECLNLKARVKWFAVVWCVPSTHATNSLCGGGGVDGTSVPQCACTGAAAVAVQKVAVVLLCKAPVSNAQQQVLYANALTLTPHPLCLVLSHMSGFPWNASFAIRAFLQVPETRHCFVQVPFLGIFGHVDGLQSQAAMVAALLSWPFGGLFWLTGCVCGGIGVTRSC